MPNTKATGVAYLDPEFTDVTITGTLTVGGSVFNAAELAALDGVTAGTVAANKAVIVDGSKNIGTFGTITTGGVTATGTVSGATVSGTTVTGTTVSGATITSTAASGRLVGNAAGGLYFLTTAITANTTETDAPAGSLGLTNNATGVGIIFVSDGSKWQLAAITQGA